MLKVKPEYLRKGGKAEFVVLTIEDFNRMNEALQDARDLHELRGATRKNAGKPYLTAVEVRRRLARRSAARRK